MRYEDLVSENHTKAILDELYEFMEIPFDLEAQNSTLGYLMHGESHASHSEYYGLFRDKDFDPNHWTKELHGKVIESSYFVGNLFLKLLIASMLCFSNYLMLRNGAVTSFKNWGTLTHCLMHQLLRLPQTDRLALKTRQ